jgi:hypothetical protein
LSTNASLSPLLSLEEELLLPPLLVVDDDDDDDNDDDEDDRVGVAVAVEGRASRARSMAFGKRRLLLFCAPARERDDDVR